MVKGRKNIYLPKLENYKNKTIIFGANIYKEQ